MISILFFSPDYLLVTVSLNRTEKRWTKEGFRALKRLASQCDLTSVRQGVRPVVF